MLLPKEKQKIIEKHRVHEKDTGSPQAQIALLTEQVKQLTGHLKDNPKDNLSRRGLLKMVAKRKALTDYMRKNDEEGYKTLMKKLGLKKKNPVLKK